MENTQYVGFWKRVIANVIDTILISVVVWSIYSIFDASGNDFFVEFTDGEQTHYEYNGRYSTDVESPAIFSFINFLLPAAIILACWHYLSATIGKMAVKAVIVDAKTGGEPTFIQLVIRYIGYLISGILFGLPFIWVGIDKRKQGLHDKAAGTLVVYR
ncbi:hypothetical protein A3K86_19985 [Photobacterium jeanii]|uniref:RDD domain-containing protein n=1 Tax=Photobacterium jeanii TaxID=858640 RepID=A0A178K1T0_9GAMM|nr:RDD family protein [Photobacterium jeanii]OAN11241.1 hypothetical protein A3K86_19985 [Photobacterium jeanii]PST90760.1 RDD family protein [Photobacterium jeanii]